MVRRDQVCTIWRSLLVVSIPFCMCMHCGLETTLWPARILAFVGADRVSVHGLFASVHALADAH